jgi:phage terminase small subunit
VSGKGKLTPKQERFVAEYLIDLNATQAAIRAGYSARTAEWQGPQLLGKTHVSTALQEGKAKRSVRTEITQDRVLQELARVAFFDLRNLYRPDGSMKQPHELDDESAAVLAGIDVVEMAGGMKIDSEQGAQHVPMYVKKAKIPDKVAALSLCMRHLGMLVEKHQVTGPGGGPIQAVSVNMTPEQLRDAVRSALEKV